MWAQVLLFALGAAQLGRAANITLYNVVATTTTTAAADATYTGLAAYDTTVLSAPAAPDPPTTALTVSIPIDVWGSGNLLSIKVSTEKWRFRRQICGEWPSLPSDATSFTDHERWSLTPSKADKNSKRATSSDSQ
jgi:hypothetical protein